MIDLDRTALESAARVVATNHIWHADDEIRPGRRDEVAAIVTGTAVLAYLHALEGGAS